MPAWLEAFYARTNGLPAFGIGPVEDIVPVGEAAVASDALELFAYEGELYFFDGEDSVIATLEETRGWWVIGQADGGESLVYADPRAARGDPAVFQIVADDARAHVDIDGLLRQIWRDARWVEAYEADLATRHDAAFKRLRALSMDELIDEFPRPGLIERIAAGRSMLPDGATEAELGALETRMGRSLPADHRAVLKRHNGYPSLSLLATDVIAAATELESGQFEHLLDVVDPTEGAAVTLTPPLTSSELEDCWVIAGVAVPPLTDGGEGQLFPQLLWCPTRPPESLYLGMTPSESYPDLASALAFRVAQVQAAFGR